VSREEEKETVRSTAKRKADALTTSTKRMIRKERRCGRVAVVARREKGELQKESRNDEESDRLS